MSLFTCEVVKAGGRLQNVGGGGWRTGRRLGGWVGGRDGSVVLCCAVSWAFKLDIAQGIRAVRMDEFFTDIENQPQIAEDYQPPLYQE